MEFLFGMIILIAFFGLLAGGIPTMLRRDDDIHINHSRADREWWSNDNDTYY